MTTQASAAKAPPVTSSRRGPNHAGRAFHPSPSTAVTTAAYRDPWLPCKGTLQLAAAGGHLQVVELLLATGANPSGKNREGLRAADLAERGGHRAVKRRLEEPQ